MVTQNNEAPILNGTQTVLSIRDTGYKSTDYALSELIDNALQANAQNVLVIIVASQKEGKVRTTTQASEIWVIDDGCGMSDKLVNIALSFGGSGHYNDRSGIGRFGMGLPQASVSQCTRTDIWTWQDSSPNNASHTYLDLKEIEKSNKLVVPWPTHPSDHNYHALPEWIVRTAENHLNIQQLAGHDVIPSGTIVSWSNLDRTRWTRSSTIRNHSEYLLGRIYRGFINGNECVSPRVIKFGIIEEEEIQEGKLPELTPIKPNDPLYLSLPKEDNLSSWHKDNPKWSNDSNQEERTIPVDDIPLFEEEKQYQIIKTIKDENNIEKTVTVRFSKTRQEGRPANYRNPGKETRQGIHTKNNRGISVIRANREITLEQTLVQLAEDRWWSVEISFDPSLDEIFGVTNNKQDVPYLTTALRLANSNDKDDDTSGIEAIREGEFDEDHQIAALYDMAADIVRKVRKIRTELKENNQRYKENKKNNNSHPNKPLPQSSIIVINEQRQKNPTKGEENFQKIVEEKGEQIAIEETAKTIEDSYKKEGLSEEESYIIRENYKQGMTFQVIENNQSQAQSFFWPTEYGNCQILNINTGHAVNKVLLAPLRLSDERIESLDVQQAKHLLGSASDALGWLLLAWCRMELEFQQLEDYRNNFLKTRDTWGNRLTEIIKGEAFTEANFDEPSIEDLFEDEDSEE